MAAIKVFYVSPGATDEYEMAIQEGLSIRDFCEDILQVKLDKVDVFVNQELIPEDGLDDDLEANAHVTTSPKKVTSGGTR